MGCLRLETLGGQAQVAGLFVALTSMRRGVGSALLAEAAEWARAAGHQCLTVTALADVPWQAPFFARCGFVPAPESTDGSRLPMRREL
ncbi:GNAT family N-acetyltransferase [Jatrophihabitans telluris]|uniref:GNAT family N-acetyltransferase n=1 Tax=Jatrophihabitans telluris TaxID=2038343 RepID=A0ABY4R7I6_9ACTN|nr:GNAT family N-acetyltransferase [Jatrophihabitans telluris]